MTKPRVVLAYSGGLDTSIIVPWLKEHYGADVICVAADVGQGEELSGLEDKARASGASACYVEDLRDDFVTGFVWPTLRAGAIYGRKYLLGTSMARPIIAKAQVEVARKVGATHLAHGCTGKGNDQVRFELTYAALAPEMKVIAPWREWDIRSREDAIEYAAAHNVPVAATKEKIYSRDRNLWHVSHEGGPIENPAWEPAEDLFLMTRSPEAAPDRAEYVEIGFEAGYPVTVNGDTHTVTPDDLTIVRRASGALVVQEEHGYFAAIDPAISIIPLARTWDMSREDQAAFADEVEITPEALGPVNVQAALEFSIAMATHQLRQRAGVLVEREVHDAFLDKLVERARQIQVGDPSDRANWLGPIIATEPVILCGDFNCDASDPPIARLQEPLGGAPAWVDAWPLVHPGPQRPHTVGLYDYAQWQGKPHCFDFFFVSQDLAARVKRVEIDGVTQASDHQPLLLDIDLTR